MSKTVLVTGASGFIGKPLCNALERAGCAVVRHSSAEGDIASCALPTHLNGGAVEHVFHLAARTFVPNAWDAPSPFYSTNVLGTVNVAEFCRRNDAALTMISSYVYGKPLRLPISEDHPVSAFNPYGHSKLLAEEVCSFYARQFGIRAVIIRPFNIYGPGQAEHFLIPTLLRQVLDAGAREISVDDDRPRRDYLFIDDLIDLLLRTMKPAARADKLDSACFNAGSGCSANPREVAELMLRIAGFEKPIVSRGKARADEVMETLADVRKARRELGWEPRFPLEDGLRRMVQEG